jgi:hypothetical protein
MPRQKTLEIGLFCVFFRIRVLHTGRHARGPRQGTNRVRPIGIVLIASAG